MRKVSRNVLCTLLAAALISGCDGPFSLTLNHVNEKGPQRNAVIAISDPQIYTRERLLNDRDDEVEFLRQQLAEVNDQDYTPRLKRDLDTLIEVVGALSAKFDPVAAASILQQSKVASLQSEVQIKELENLLNKIEKDKTPAKDPAAAESPPKGPEAQDSDELNPVAPNTLATEMHKFLTELHSLVLTRVDDPDTKRPKQRTNEVSSATPSEVFRDKMAYRNEILAALQQAQLDDRHDLNGNALYRLQIKATVFPGKIKDKYAITRMTILPPKFENNNTVSRLYLDWLAYVAQQLNPVQSDDKVPLGDQEIAARYTMLGPATGTFRVNYLPYKAAPAESDAAPSSDPAAKQAAAKKQLEAQQKCDLDKLVGSVTAKKLSELLTDCRVMVVPTPPEFGQGDVMELADFEKAQQVGLSLQAAASSVVSDPRKYELNTDGSTRRRCALLSVGGAKGELLKAGATTRTDAEGAKNQVLKASELSPKQVAAIFIIARNIYNLAPSYFLAIERTRQNYARSGAGSADALVALQGYAQSLAIAKEGANDLLTALHGKLENNAQCNSFEEVAGRIWVPEAFYRAVTAEPDTHGPDAAASADNQGQLFTAGSAYAYSTAPTELAQRVSTVASATEAMDLMASISALIPSASVGINAAGEMRRVASGQVDAVESAPLIVGFSNNGAANKAAQQVLAYGEEPSFGWVFGPKVIVNTEDSELELSQVLVNQPVTADVSVPGWWTEMRLRIETAWAANFDKALLQPANKDGTPLKTEEVSSYSIDVPLQSNPESYEQLTQFIASKAWGLQQHEPVIIDVEPKAIAACSRVTVLISGPDLWRGRAVYLAGTPAENTQIMPDMRGLAATFVLPRSAIGTANLVVWTQLGKVESSVTVKSSANCGTDGNSSAGLAEATVEPTVAWLGSKLAIRAGGAWPDTGGVFSGFIFPNGNQAQITAIPTANIAFSDPILEAMLPDAVEGNKLVEGTAFSGAIQYEAGQDKTTIAQFGPFYLYSAEDQASIRIASGASTVSQKDLKEKGVVLTVTLPKNLAKAYRSLMDDGLTLALADEDGKIVGRRTDFTFSTDDSTDRQVKYRLKLDAKPILGDADGTLTVTVVVGGGTTPPQFPHVTEASLAVTK